MTYLNAADELVVDLLIESLSPFIIYARPTPNILPLAIIPRPLQDASRDSPHDDTEEEEPNGEDGVVDAGLFGSPVTPAEVRPEDHYAEGERHTGGSEDDVLGPGLRAAGPGRERAAGGQAFGGEEDVDGGADEGEDDEAAPEVDAAEEQLDGSHADLCFLDCC